MAKDGRALREEAAAAVAAGKHKRALAAYIELERLEANDAQWPKRAGETYRRLGNLSNAIEAFERSADRYAQNGFLVQAIAVCKVILQIAPNHADTLRRLAEMNERIGASQTRAASMAENNPALHENPSVAAIRGRTTESAMRALDDGLSRPRKESEIFRRARQATPPNIAVGRSKSRPIALPLGAALDTVDLKTEVPESHSRDDEPGIHVIPIDEEDFEQDTTHNTRQPLPAVEPVWEIDGELDTPAEVAPEHSDSTELDLSDIEEIPLPRPRVIGSAAARALAATPLFAGMPSDALQALVANLQLVSLERGDVLFRAGDPSDALYVIVEGELSVQGGGPPAAELSRLGPGAFLGEVALMTDQPRNATVICLSPAELLRIDRHTLSRVLANHGDVLRAVLRFVRDRLVDRWMRTSPLFRPFDDAQRIELAAKFKFLEIDAGTVVLGTGERPDGLYIVLAGQFMVLRNGSAVAQLGPGDLIGETALLSGGAFKSDVVARGKGLALCLPAAVFREVIMTHPHVLEYIGEQAEHSRRLQIL
ncbi:MAG TPA: cyclic nucleotide-binding domain-containing protein [Kofleriaceae bacterium]|jgi:CRP-like cAMP-binding protein|nr:cyclic nucleotide-binding domain-containing protein [Kofleriaceae bacterium]